MNAALVLGQSNFVNNENSTTQSGMYDPMGLAADASGDVWVADFENSRVLEFSPPYSNGMNAALVLGQGNFTASRTAVTQSGLNSPWSAAVDASGNVWVADEQNNRVLSFASAKAFSGVLYSSFTAAWSANGNPAGTLYTAQLSMNGFATIAKSSTTANTYAVFTGLSAGSLYDDRVAALGPGGAQTSFAPLGDIQTSGCSGPFTFAALQAQAGLSASSWAAPAPHQSTIRAADLADLRLAVGFLLSNAGLTAYPWTNPIPVAHSSFVQASDVADLQAALSAVYAACSQTPPAFSDPSPAPHSSRIRAADLSDLRSAVLNAK
jgi:hypothetical protein